MIKIVFEEHQALFFSYERSKPAPESETPCFVWTTKKQNCTQTQFQPYHAFVVGLDTFANKYMSCDDEMISSNGTAPLQMGIIVEMNITVLLPLMYSTDRTNVVLFTKRCPSVHSNKNVSIILSAIGSQKLNLFYFLYFIVSYVFGENKMFQLTADVEGLS